MEDITFDERKMYQSPNKKSSVVLVSFKSSIFLSPIYTNAWVDQLAVRVQELTLVHGTTNKGKLLKKRNAMLKKRLYDYEIILLYRIVVCSIR